MLSSVRNVLLLGGGSALARDYLGNPALFELNNTDSRYALNGVRYGSSAELYAALGATVSGIRAVFGDYLAPGEYEYFLDPGFNTGTPWAAASGDPYFKGNGASPAVNAGQLEVTYSSATTAYLSFRMDGLEGRAFRFTAKGSRGTSTTGGAPTLRHTQANSSLAGNLINAASSFATGALVTYTVWGSGRDAASPLYFGILASSPGNGVALVDDWSIKETLFVPGLASPANGDENSDFPGWGGIADVVLPALPVSGEKVIWQNDASSTIHRTKLAIDTTGALTLIGRQNATDLATLALGTFAQGDRVRVAFGVRKGTNNTEKGFVASVNGGARISSVAATVQLAGCAFMRIALDHSGTSQFDGTLNQIIFMAGRPPNDWCEYTSRLDNTSLIVAGDSYVDGASGISLKATLATATGLKCINIAAGGSSLADQVATSQSKPYLTGLRFVHWDGSDNNAGTAAEDVANYQVLSSLYSGRVLFVAPVPVPNPAGTSSPTPTTQSTRCAARYSAMVTAFGAGHVFDALTVLQGLSTGSADDLNDVAAGLVPRSCLFDSTNGQVHLSSVAMTAVAAAIQSSGKIAAL